MSIKFSISDIAPCIEISDDIACCKLSDLLTNGIVSQQPPELEQDWKLSLREAGEIEQN